MTAKEMFESMGWKQIANEPSYIGYDRGYRTIYFMRNDESGIITSSGHINMHVLKAINEQCKELGWLDDSKRNV